MPVDHCKGVLRGSAPGSPAALALHPGPVVGVALGGGAARGAAHIGVLRELQRRGIPIDVVAGTSIGALVGAAYAAGRLDRLEGFAASLTWRRLLRMADPGLDGGVVQGRRIEAFLEALFGELRFEDLPKRLVVVATALPDGEPVVLSSGPLVDAVRASIAVPGLLAPVRYGSRWLVDGGLVELLPVRAARAWGAEVVIGVDIRSRHDVWGRLARRLKHAYGRVTPQAREWRRKVPVRFFIDQAPADRMSFWNVVGRSLEVAVRLQGTTDAGDDGHPDVLIRPAVEGMHGHQFLRWAEGVQAGRMAVEDAWPRLSELFEEASASGMAGGHTLPSRI
ncbi:MAG: patatin-like phospholipase family protein [Limnochordaceae bacterium]|nr:patatin-like phospholipase family protein [Limnochordaceae bacterium]